MNVVLPDNSKLELPDGATGLDAARAIGAADGERRRQRPEFGDQGFGPAGGFGGPGGAEERVQEGSAPVLVSLRWWA